MRWFMNIFQSKYHVKSTKVLQSEDEECNAHGRIGYAQ